MAAPKQDKEDLKRSGW